jgi:hypothetical protein
MPGFRPRNDVTHSPATHVTKLARSKSQTKEKLNYPFEGKWQGAEVLARMEGRWISPDRDSELGSIGGHEEEEDGAGLADAAREPFKERQRKIPIKPRVLSEVSLQRAGQIRHKAERLGTNGSTKSSYRALHRSRAKLQASYRVWLLPVTCKSWTWLKSNSHYRGPL